MIEAPARATLGPAPAENAGERIRERIRLAAFCLLLAVLPFVTAPGNIISDTKLDLTVNPVRFLTRALTLWDPTQFGQLQNQADGYLFPMGPFFVLGKLAGLEPWVVQRLWIGAVLIAAFLGTVALAGRLRIGSPWTRVLAGMCYAMSPLGLGLAGVQSVLFLPAAMLPWVLLPLARQAWPASGGWRRARAHAGAAARSALAVAACGGTNASATIPVLVTAALFLLARSRPAPRWRLLPWWVPFVVLATAWWSIPLVLLDKYGVSFLPYTESAAVTTSVTSLWDILRGTEDWTSYLVMYGQPWDQLAYKIATDTLPTVFTGLIAGLGVAGLIRRRLPERRFLLVSLLTGVIIIATGYVSSLGNPLAGLLHHLINGPAAPFRNLWKFDPLIRLPIALGIAHLAAAAGDPRLAVDPRDWLSGPAPDRARRLRQAAAGGSPLNRTIPLLASLAVAGLAVPAYLGGLAGLGSFPQIPGYWVSAASWLNHHAGRQNVLVVPGAAFAQYVWGSPQDDVLQPLSTVNWAERNLTTIGSPGNERLIEAIDQRLAAGDGSAGLTQVLAQLDVKYVVVRNDLIRSSLYGAWPARVNDALASSPGITQVARFGAPIGSSDPGDAAGGFDPPYPSVEIYRVRGTAPTVSVVPASAALRVYGAPEAVLPLADEGLLGQRPVLLNSDSPGLPAAASVVTDTLRRRVVNFGEVRTQYSPTLAATQSTRTFEAASDFTEPGWSHYQSVVRYLGIRNVTASSSASGIGSIPANWASGAMPYAAVDGDLRTMWESGSWRGPVGQWIQLAFDRPVTTRVIHVTFVVNADLGPAVSRVEISTAAGRVADRVDPDGDTHPLRVPSGATSWLRITVTGLTAKPHPLLGSQVGISEISVPGVQASRVIVAPPVADPASQPSSAAAARLAPSPLPADRRGQRVSSLWAAGPGEAADPTALVLAKTEPFPTGCMRTSSRWVCSPLLGTLTEEEYGFDQAFTMPATSNAHLRGSAVIIAAKLTHKYVRFGGTTWVHASSTYTADPADLPRSAFDGNQATTWIASPSDAHPWLRIRWEHPRTVSQVKIRRPAGASGLLQVLVSGLRGQVRGGTVSSTGTLRFRPMRTTVLTFTFTPIQTPLEITDVVVPGVPSLGAPSGPFHLPCGYGPLLELNGKVVPTQVSGTFADLLDELPMQFTACSQVRLAAGANRVVEPAADGFSVQSVVLDRSSARAPLSAVSPARPGRVLSWTSQRRSVQVAAAGSSYLVIPQNFNAGWRAVLAGQPLRAVRLDGWEQAWLLPAGSAGIVHLTYLPNARYQKSLIGAAGALLVVLLIAVAARPGIPALADGGAGGGAPGSDPGQGTSDRARLVPATAPSPASARARWAVLRRRLAVGLAVVAIVAGLLLAGFWLGGFPGAAILTGAAWLFMAAASYRSRGWFWLEFARPRLLTGLLLAALVSGVAGERLLWAGGSGLLVTGLWNTVPQVVCLVILGRLVAAVILPDP